MRGWCSGGNTKDGGRWGTADEAHFLLCGPVCNRQRPLVVRYPTVGNPYLKTSSRWGKSKHNKGGAPRAPDSVLGGTWVQEAVDQGPLVST